MTYAEPVTCVLYSWTVSSPIVGTQHPNGLSVDPPLGPVLCDPKIKEAAN